MNTPLIDQLILNLDQLSEIKKTFNKEINLAFEHQSSCLQCYNTHISLPIELNSTEYFLAVDLGGTNLRVALCKNVNSNVTIILNREDCIDSKLLTGSIVPLFDWIAIEIAAVLVEIGMDKPINVGFTFSFSVNQHSKNKATLLHWSKGYDLDINFDPVLALQDALARVGLLNAKVVSLINDTTATLLANYLVHPCCDVGLIIGTGTNMCLAVSQELSGEGKAEQRLIFNLESGNFNINLPRLPIDEELDVMSFNPQKQLVEKMIGGLYLGELVSLLCSKYFKNNNYLFEWNRVNYLSSKQIGQFQYASFEFVFNYFKSNLNISLDFDDIQFVVQACHNVSLRSAQLSAALLAGALIFLDSTFKYRHIVGIDGSLYRLYPGYKKMFEKTFFELVPQFDSLVHFSSVEQASLIGNALAVE